MPLPRSEISSKNFGVAVSLCGIFGIVGIHHFYLGNIMHGLIDLGLFVAAMVLMYGSTGPMVALGFALLLIDIAHTLWVMIMLFIGKTRDSQGRIVAYPGQFR